MDEGDTYRAGNSLCATSSTTWRNHASMVDVFSRSSRDEYDEEALRWAALEKLPTFERLQKGILTAGGGANQIDIWNLGFHDRKRLLERLVRVTEEDNEGFLLKLRSCIDRVGIDLPTIEVRFEHLKVEAEAHEGSRALPTVINFCTSILEGFLNFLHVLPSRKKHLTILQDVSGIIKPGRMTLLLGPPSSGKTTLLLALAGKLDPELKMASGLFRLIAALGRNLIVANTFGSFVLLALVALGGVVLSREDVKKWWIWGYWTSPLMYGQNAIVVNELLGSNWNKIPPNSSTNEPLGIQVLKSRGFFTEAYWYWIGVGALFGFIILFNFGFSVALALLNPFGKSHTVKSDDPEGNKNVDRIEGSIQLQSRGSRSSFEKKRCAQQENDSKI